MRRREFITGIAGAAAAWPLAAQAQQPAMPVIGFLHSGLPEPSAHILVAFRQSLQESGYVERQNVAIEYRWAYGQYDRLPELAADLVRRQVAVIATGGGEVAAAAAMAATATIPIVFTSGVDPVQAGLVSSLNRPGGNITGVSSLVAALGAKRLGLLRGLVPRATTFALLVNLNNPHEPIKVRDAEAAAETLGHKVVTVTASTEREVDAAFATVVEQHASAIIVASDAFFVGRRDQLVGLAARHALPAIYELREYAIAGGLISYGPSLSEVYRQAGVYVSRILRGEKPADLPVVQPTKLEMVINLKTARTLGLSVPPIVLALADEVIE